MYEAEYPFYEIALRLVAAMVGGAILGIEREAKHKPAGLRTNMLVSLGAAATMLLTLDLCREVAAFAMQTDASKTHVPNFDAIRTVAGVIGGIGFLGAGAIFKSQGDVEGLTTAAAIWTSGAIGLACGAGRFEIAGTTVVLAFVILAIVDWITRAVAPRKSS
jgi:putative Mg2+ transporter-C (MgtC) family protein